MLLLQVGELLTPAGFIALNPLTERPMLYTMMKTVYGVYDGGITKFVQ